MHTHVTLQTTLAADVFDRLIALDALLGHADQDDKADLMDRLSGIDRDEFKHLLEFAAMAPGAPPSSTPVPAETATEVEASVAATTKETPAHV